MIEKGEFSVDDKIRKTNGTSRPCRFLALQGGQLRVPIEKLEKAHIGRVKTVWLSPHPEFSGNWKEKRLAYQ